MSHSAYIRYLPSPFGPLFLGATEQGLCAVCFAPGVPALQRQLARHGISLFREEPSSFLEAASAYLQAYFAGEAPPLTFPLDLRGTAFQRLVWEALLTIPYGETRAYSEIAAQIGHPRAIRAVGRAVGANPISLIVPCHRVIGRNGDLVGYGGGLKLKQALLALEHGLREPSLDV